LQGFVIVGSLLLPMASSFALIGQQLTVYHAKAFDIPAYLIDNSYGFSASATLWGLTSAHAALHQFIGIIYGWLPAAISTCYALNVRARNRDAGNLLKAALAGGAIPSSSTISIRPLDRSTRLARPSLHHCRTQRLSRQSRRDWRCPAPRAIACPQCTSGRSRGTRLR
jgi:hypothetical protein